MALVLGWSANLAANALMREWAPGIILYGAINMAQVWLAAWALRSTRDDSDILADAPAAFNFLFWAGLAAPAAGALAGSALSVMNYGEPFLPSLERWYSSNALGFVILTPFLKSCFDGRYIENIRSSTHRQRAESLSLLILHGAVCIVTFGQSGLPLLFAPLCSLLFLAFRSGRLATQAGVVMVGVSGALAAIYHVGPVALIDRDAVFEAIFFQTYLATLLAIALPVAALVASRGEALAEAARREELLRMILKHSPDAILSFDSNGVCQWADGETENLLGLGAADCHNASIEELARKTGATLSKLYYASLASPHATHVGDLVRVDHSARKLEAGVKAVFSGDMVVGVVATIRDVTAQWAREKEIARLAQTDPLTKISNRAGFEAALTALRERSGPICVALIDIDNFKAINDRFGHQVGDRVLVEVAAIASRLMIAPNHVSRLGGDEFAILSVGDISDGQRLLEQIRDAVLRLAIAPDALRITVSAGIAELQRGSGIEAAYMAADRGLYLSKRSGRNCVHAIETPVTSWE